MRRKFIALAGGTAVAVVALWFFAAPAAVQATGTDSTPLGLWLTEKKGILVELYPCLDQVCGRVVWLAKPYRKSGELRRDRHNPDPRLRSRSWCGSEVIEGLEPDAEGNLKSGKFYYLGDGGTYSLELKNNGNGTLKANAYLGIKLIGKSETWTRPGSEIVPGCPPAS